MVFAVHKLENISSNRGKVHFEGLVHLLRYVRDNTTLGLKCSADIIYAPLSELLRQANIDTKNQFIDFSNSSWQNCSYNGRSTGAYIILFQVGPIDHGTHFPGPVAQSSAEIEYNAAYTAEMALAHFRMLIHELLNKDPDIISEEATIIISDRNSALCMDNNCKDNKHTWHIVRIVYFVRNGKKRKNAQD